MSGGFARSINSSRRICSSAESTSFRVETWCCASTTRHGVSWSGRSSEMPAHRVQILDDIDETLHGADPFGGHAAEMRVCRVQPLAGLVVLASDECVESSIEPQGKKGELSLLSVRVQTTPLLKPGYRGLAGSHQRGNGPVPEAQSLRG